MPQDKPYWNPYRLVPARDKVERAAPTTHERFQGHSGIIECELENLTPLFIGGQTTGDRHPPLLRENKRVIPGSSLKGLLRALVEIVGGGCRVVGTSPTPHEMQACSRISRLCVACRMFGAMERGSNARVHQGKVCVGDAPVIGDALTITLKALLANKGVEHEPFYRSPHTGTLDGKSRKVYFHQPRRTDSVPAIPQNLQGRAWDFHALKPGHRFKFQVQFTNLDDEELSLLLYALGLEDDVEVIVGPEKLKLKGPMRHKIGAGKPLGLGSCRISLTRLSFLPSPSERFSAMTVKPRVLEGKDLEAEIRKRTDKWRNDKSETMNALRKMMVWDDRDSREFRYPSYSEFQEWRRIGQAPLKKI